MQVPIECQPQSSDEPPLPHEATYMTRDWNENVLHVYPRTFYESRHENGKHIGVGSILGITEKLDWMQETGVTAIWLGPIYESPGFDPDYDVSDYRKINPELGTLEDAKHLIAEAHARDIRVIFDLVPNHTSSQSQWFEASSNPNHPEYDTYKDYYIWKDPVPGALPKSIVGAERLVGLPDGLTVPNNWSSIFSLPQIEQVRSRHNGTIPEGIDIPAVTAWVWHAPRQQFYLAEFMKEQPSLNWSNAAVREEIKSIVRYWLDMGVDSFRVDVINHIGKDTNFQDEEPAPIGNEIGQYNPGVTNPHDKWKQENLVSHWPELGEYAHDLLSVLDEQNYRGKNIRFVFEDWMSALGNDERLDSLRPDKANVFNFLTLLNTTRERWNARNIGTVIHNYYTRLQGLDGAVPNQVTGNHDTDTIRTRLGSAATARAAYLVLAALPGALYTWQGDVLGRPNAIIPVDRQRDGGIGLRDGERIPMQWDDATNGGFSRARPDELWLPAVDPRIYQRDNLEVQARDPQSPYRFVQSILKRRKIDSALHNGSLRMLHTDNNNVLAYARTDPKNPRRQVISVTNMSQDTQEVSIHDAAQTSGIITLSAAHGYESGNEALTLKRPFQLSPDASYLLDSAR